MAAVKIANYEIGPIGLGLMGLTWRVKPIPDEEAFAVMKGAYDRGSNFWNAGEFYNTPNNPFGNLKLIRRFFDKYPELKDKVVISVKGAVGQNLAPDTSKENVRRSIDNIIKELGDKKLDFFEPARIDRATPIEETVGAIAEYVEAGKIGGISLSEVSAETIRKAQKVHKISAVEIEYSLAATEARTNGVLEACAELGIVVIAYSPLGRGMLCNEVKARKDIPEGDLRLYFPRFSEENFTHNMKIPEMLEKLADKRGITPSKLALAWILKSQELYPGLHIVPIPGSTKVSRLDENCIPLKPELTDSEFKQLEDLIAHNTVQGDRYPEPGMHHLYV